METAAYQPRLTAWSHTWRYGLCLLISAAAWAEIFMRQWQDHRAWFWAGLGLALITYPLVLLRRRWPVPIAVIANVVAAISAPAAGPAALANLSLATRRRYREIIPVGIVAVACAVIYSRLPNGQDRTPLWLAFSINTLVTVLAFAWGMYVGSRRELLVTLKAQVAHAAAEQDLRADQARSAERSRIAREMHDVLAHRVSQVSMQANAIMFREDLTAAEMREQVGLIQTNAREALADLRSVLGVLRDPANGALMDRPQPTYVDIPALIETEIANGANVTLTSQIDGSVPDLVGRTAYRIVQEALTNARKHAPGAAVSVSLGGGPSEGLTLTIRNALGFSSGTPGAQLGLLGLRERAELAGGRFEATREQQAWVVRGWIPWAT